ncbi:unnamed protein product [Peronospora belbahrii]|uniref:Uncharacterized protein n=1 Tax=Peronospora belbahrii TaxID=622444 RepID=A0ABN8CWB9_9STRA|nr:unnamed protein product [Peronospora belbahrii]
METMKTCNLSAHQQLCSFMSLSEDDDLAQLILEELAFSRRAFTGIAARIANSPSSISMSGLDSISEDEEGEGEE